MENLEPNPLETKASERREFYAKLAGKHQHGVKQAKWPLSPVVKYCKSELLGVTRQRMQQSDTDNDGVTTDKPLVSASSADESRKRTGPVIPKEAAFMTEIPVFGEEYNQADFGRESVIKGDYQEALNDSRYLRSWDGYVIDIMLGSSYVSEAGIFTQLGERLSTSKGLFNTHSNEVVHIVKAFPYPLQLKKEGISIAGKHHKVLMADGRHGILAAEPTNSRSRVACELKSFRYGASVCRTHGLIIIGVHRPPMSAQYCNDVVMTLCDFFLRKGL